MKKLIILMLLFISVACYAQPPSQKTLVEDETWVVASGKSSFRVITSNDSIAHWFMKKYEKKGIVRFTYVQKRDRKGLYWERSFYFKNEEWNNVVEFIKAGFK